MSDDKAQQEPSMEDILASIRRILSEDEVEEPKPAPQPEPEPVPAPAPVVASPQDDIDALFAAPSSPQDDIDALFAAPSSPQDDIDALFAATAQAEEPEPEPEDDVFELTNDMALDPIPVPAPAPAPVMPVQPIAAVDDESLLSPPTAARGTSLLSDLAREITRHRSVNHIGNGALTLEDMVREMLKPVLKQWLDDNLPSMIERIVKSEIEKMVNRAENQ